MTQQLIVTDTKLAALLSYMGYEFRVVKDSLGPQFLFSHSGDIGEAVQAYEQNAQVSSAKTLLEVYDEFLEQLKGQASLPTEQGQELLPTKIETELGREWVTKDFNTATLLLYRGNELLRTYVEAGRTEFVFSRDAGLMSAVSLYNQKKLRVEPAAWMLAGFKVRDAMREAKGYNTVQRA